eukprot:6257613-Amphidinium_carterae.1
MDLLCSITRAMFSGVRHNNLHGTWFAVWAVPTWSHLHHHDASLILGNRRQGTDKKYKNKGQKCIANDARKRFACGHGALKTVCERTALICLLKRLNTCALTA